MRVATLIRSYKLTDMLPQVIEQYAWTDKILVMNYRFPNVEEVKENTIEIAERYGCDIDVGHGMKQHEILNRGMFLLKDYDCVFISDADEFILRKDQDTIVSTLGEHHAVTSRVIDYTDFEHALPQRDHKPVVAVNPHRAEFYDVRCVHGSVAHAPVDMHHFWYAWKDEQLDWKHKNKWYNEFHELMAKPREDRVVPKEIYDTLCRTASR